MKVTCTKCNKEFNMLNKMVKTRKVGASIEEIFFRCPKCKESFVIMKTNPKIRELQRKVQELVKTGVESLILPARWELKKECDRFNGKTSPVTNTQANVTGV